jgi:hypothetical protein
LLTNTPSLMNDPAPLREAPAEKFSRLIDVSIKGTANVIRAFEPATVKAGRGGRGAQFRPERQWPTGERVSARYGLVKPQPSRSDGIPAVVTSRNAARQRKIARLLQTGRRFASSQRQASSEATVCHAVAPWLPAQHQLTD